MCSVVDDLCLPSRNKIVFSDIPTQLTFSICNDNIKEFIISNINFFTDGNKYTVQSSYNGISLECNNEIEYEAISGQLIHLKIGDRIIKTELLQEVIQSKIIYRQFDTFHQNDDKIREKLYSILSKLNVKVSKNMLLIGGECYIYEKLFKSLNVDIYSDFQSIVDDCLINNPKANVSLVNYSNMSFESDVYDSCIINIGKHGLKDLAIKVNQLKIKDVYYISCNKKSFDKDMIKLSNYKTQEEWDMRNSSYGIQLYHIVYSL
jgi:hypothetical protein